MVTEILGGKEKIEMVVSTQLISVFKNAYRIYPSSLFITLCSGWGRSGKVLSFWLLIRHLDMI